MDCQSHSIDSYFHILAFVFVSVCQCVSWQICIKVTHMCVSVCFMTNIKVTHMCVCVSVCLSVCQCLSVCFMTNRKVTNTKNTAEKSSNIALRWGKVAKKPVKIVFENSPFPSKLTPLSYSLSPSHSQSTEYPSSYSRSLHLYEWLVGWPSLGPTSSNICFFFLRDSGPGITLRIIARRGQKHSSLTGRLSNN